MRFLLAKDLRILRRSPLLVGLLVVYPAIIAVLLGLALSGGPSKPRVAVLNQLNPNADPIAIGGTRVDPDEYAQQLLSTIDPIMVRTRAEAERKVRDGDALAALIVPGDLLERLRATVALSTSRGRPTVEVLYNGEDPVKRRFVESTIDAKVAELNAAVAGRLVDVAGRYLDIILRGGGFGILGERFEVLGLERSQQLIDGVLAHTPPSSPDASALGRVSRFAGTAIENLGLSDEILGSLTEPIVVRQHVLDGGRTPLDAFAVAVTVALSLFLVTVLLASGMLALEREEHAFARLARGLVSRTGIVAEKLVLAALCGLLMAIVLAAGVSLFVDLDWGRFPLWVAALAVAGLAFGAFGVALGGLAGEVRGASLLAILLALPIAFLALVPGGAVAPALYDAIRVISALFPFRPALHAIDAALNGGGRLGASLLHLAALAAGWGVLARAAVQRYA